MFNEALEYESDMIVMPESSIPLEWLMLLVRRCMNNQTGLITGVEHVIGNRYVFNYTAIILPVKDERRYRDAFLGMHLKRHYSPGEVERIRNMGYLRAIGLTMELYDWNNLWFTVFCCFELSDIQSRGKFRSLVDMMFVVECNKDVNYFGNIIDSTSRDLHCYCIQVNHSKYGDSRITEPKSTEKKDCIVIKGGMNTAVLVSKLEIGLFRHKQLYTRDKGDLKPLPPGFDEDMVRARVMGKMWNRICTPCNTKKDDDGMSG